MKNESTVRLERMFSLDLLRGLDMFLLVVIGTLLRTADQVWGLPPWLMKQISHPWGGFTLWDIIMPLFIFMCGAAMPFALGRRMVGGRPTWGFWLHVAWRILFLWVLGMVNQGHLLTLDPIMISPYNNTLQTIAAGYLIVALAMCVPSKWFRRLLPIGLAGAYTFLLAWGGDYSKDGNFAMRFEVKVLSMLVPDGSEAYKLYGYTWFLTSLMFGAMALTGFNATDLLRCGLPKWKKCGLLAAGGAVMLLFGHCMTSVVPMIKQIFTLSFTLAAMGWCCFAYAALYALSDILMIRRGMGLFILFGQCSLVAYMAGYFTPVFIRFGEMLLGGLERWIGPHPMPFVYVVFKVVALTGLLVAWRRLKRGSR